MATAAKDEIDLRYLFLRGLIEHEINQRSRHYLKSAAECTSRAIVSLELSEQPITSVKQARRLEGVGGETCTRLSKLFEERNFSSLKPLQGRFVSSAGAILVALLDLANNSAAKDVLVPEDKVKERARVLCEEQFREEDKEGFCVAWWRLEVLIKKGFIKRRSQKKIPVLQLLPKGIEIAKRLKGPTNLSGVQNQRISEVDETEIQNRIGTGDEPCVTSKGQLRNGLYKQGGKSSFTNDRGKDGVVLLVDLQEMGGERAGLGELCRLLDQNGVCYRTRKLRTGDYGWCWRRGSTEVILPCLVERKRADDIPCTLKEGRFWSQINRMLEWKKDFTDHGIDCSIHYILERKPEEFVVKCVDGCQGIGQCGNPTLPQIKMVIGDLKQHPELLVKETGSLEITALLLKSMTNDLIERAEKGEFDMLLAQASQKSIVKNETNHFLHSAELELTDEEQLKLAMANSLKDITEIHCNSNAIIPVDKDSQSLRKTCILENNESELFQNTDANLISEKNFKLVEENSPNNIECNNGNSTDLLKEKNSLQNLARSVSKTPCITTTFSNNEPSSNRAFLSKSPANNSLLQYSSNADSSKILDNEYEHTREEEILEKYLSDQINNKRSSFSPSQSTKGLVNEFDQTGTHASYKRPKIHNPIKESVSEFKCSNSLLTLGSSGETLPATTNVPLLHRKESNENEAYEDKIDDILDSLRCSSSKTVARKEVKETISIIDDEIEEITEHRTKVKLKPIKLKMSPSKLFVEPNIPTLSVEKKRSMKRKLVDKVKQEIEENLICSADNINRVSGPGDVNTPCSHSGTSEHRRETVIYSRKEHVDSTCDGVVRNKSQSECRDTDLDNAPGSVTYDCDKDSNTSIQDIFADTSSQEDFRGSDILTNKTTNTNNPNEKDNEVRKWLTICDKSDEEVNYVKEIHKRPKCYIVREDSDDSLPDIVTDFAGFGDKPYQAVDLDKQGLDDVIDITDDSSKSIFTSPIQSGERRSRSQLNKKIRHRRKNRNDSGFETEGIRGQPTTCRIPCGELDIKIETVLAILPHIHRDKVIEMLQKHAYDVEQSISELLDQVDDVDHSEEYIDLTD